MYSRKIKLMTGKKKGKSGAPPVSNWGPRIALAEKEKALSQCLPETVKYSAGEKSADLVHTGRKQNSYCINNAQLRNHHNQNNVPPPAPPKNSGSNYRKVPVSSSSTGSSGNNYIYNYARKASSGGSSHKSFFLANPSYRSSHRSSSNKTSNGGGSSYVLGSNSGSHVTLSTVGETMSQPLTLIIPSVSSDRFIERESDFEDEDDGYNVMADRDQDSFPSTKTYCSSQEEEVESSENDECHKDRHKHVTTNGKGNLIPNKTDSIPVASRASNRNPSNMNPLPSKSEQIFSNPAINLGILKVSTTKPIIHHEQIPQYKVGSGEYDLYETERVIELYNKDKRLNDMKNESIENNEHAGFGHSQLHNTHKETLSAISDLKKICNSSKNKNNSIGSTISSLAAGITMVYVPMESLPRSKSAAVLNASLEFDLDLSKLVKESMNEIVSEEEETNFPAVDDEDPDNDSLLESFDSVMFKPKDDKSGNPIASSPCLSSGSSCSNTNANTPTQPQSPNVTITNINCEKSTHRNQSHGKIAHFNPTSKDDKSRQSIVIPPPLPPKNPSMLKLKPKLKFNDNMFANIARRNNNNFKPSEMQSSPSPPSASQREKNIRTAVENLENIIRPQSASPPEPIGGRNKDHQMFMKPQKSNKRVTLTLPNECLSKDEQELLLLHNLRTDTDTEIDAYSSTFLTCGHVLKEDDYSTLSSTHSPATRQILAVEDMHDDFNDLDQQPPSSSSSPEASPTHTSDPCSSSGGEHSPSEDKDKNRSVLQQLRELSILIGGGGTGPYVENDKLFSQIRNQKETSSTALDKSTANNNSFRLHEENPTRKLSDADSGKGSGTSVSISGSSPKSAQSSPDSLQLDSANQQKQINCHGVSSPCVFRSDCNECLMYNKPLNGFKKPDSSAEICGKSDTLTGSNKSLKKQSTGSNKKLPSKLIVRRKSSRSSKSSSKTGSKSNRKKSKNLILEYCECSSCGCDFDKQQDAESSHLQPLQVPKLSVSSFTSSESVRKISTTSSSSGHSSSVKLSRSVAFRSLSRHNNNPRANNNSKSSPTSQNSELSSNGLFTIEEEENASVDSKLGNNKFRQNDNLRRNAQSSHSAEAGGDIDVRNGSPHWHPECWLAADPLLSGWSDLESLYSLNVKNDKPLSINGECWTCWAEISEIKRNSENPNGTVDRTKRMFIWLNKRHKEFQAPWWEAKKQASIRWVMTKALIHVPKEYLIDPFKESKKSKPIKYRLREEVIKGLVSGKLYSLALENLYRETLGGGHPGHSSLCHWEIIKILSRRGVYVAQPSDMKLTEGTLRQKPIRIAAHIALIEAIMCLYSKEILARERIIATLFTFGCTVKPETTSPEKLVIAWINASVMTLKSYIVRNHQLSSEKQSRWLQLPKIGEIRDLCDGIGICSLFAIYCSNDLNPMDISVPEPGETLTIYDSISNHTLVQKLCEDLFPETMYHLCVTDFLYIHGYMKQNILCFLVDLFIHLEVNPIVRVNRLTH